MRTKRMLLGIIMLIILTSVSSAKKTITGNPTKIAELKLNHLQKDIVLTDSQIVVFKNLTTEYIKKVNLADDTQIEFISVKYKESVDSILTTQQKEKLKQNRQTKINKINKQ